jgi:hypothetical protein
MALTRELYMELEGSIQETFDAFCKTKTDYRSMLYNMSTSSRSQENHLGFGTFGQMVEWNGQVHYDTLPKGYEQNYRHIKYSNGVTIEDEIIRFKEYNTIRTRANGLAYGVHKTLQVHGASTFNNAFDATVTGPDGVSLCNASHRVIPGAPVQSNTGVLDLSVDNLETVINAMAAFKDDRDDIMDVQGRLIICGNYWKKTAKQICGSEKEPYVADNQINVFKDDLDYLCVPWITGKKWFLVDPDLMKMGNGLNWYTARNPDKIEADSNPEFDTEAHKFKTVGMWSKGWDNFFWLYGNNPS